MPQDGPTPSDRPGQTVLSGAGWLSGPCTAEAALNAQQAPGLRQGDRVELIAVPADPDYENAGLSAGERGAVELIDSLCTVHIRWDSGRHLGITDRHRDLIRPIG